MRGHVFIPSTRHKKAKPLADAATGAPSLSLEPRRLPVPSTHASRAPRQSGFPPNRAASRGSGGGGVLRAHRCKERSASSPSLLRQGANALQPRIRRFTSALQAAFTPTALCPPRPSAHAQTPPPARNSSPAARARAACARERVRSPQTHRLCLRCTVPSGTSPLPVSRHLAARTAAPLICTPLCATPTPPPPTHLLRTVHATPARAPRAVARRRGGSAPACCGGAVGGGLRMRSQRHLAATELTRACTSFVCLHRLSFCPRVRGAFRARSAAPRAPARI